MFKKISARMICLAILSTLGLGACNIFDPLDSPTSDAQLLSAARACFDRGDFTCAREYYGKLSGSNADTASAEQSFITLDEQGASMGAYMEFVANLSDKGPGPALTVFANRLTTSAGAAKRQAIWQVFSNASTGIANNDLKNFVIFISATALAAEMLAEAPAAAASILPGNLAKTATTCLAVGISGCAASASCDSPTTTNLQTQAAGALSTTVSPSASYATIRQFYDAINQSLTALNNLSASGKFSAAVNSFQTMKTLVTGAGGDSSLDTSPGDRCLRETLLEQNFGTI